MHPILTMTFVVWVLYSLKITVFSALSAFYKTKKENPTRARNVSFVIVTIANRGVKDSLLEVLKKTSKFGIPRHVVIDEGAELTDCLAKKGVDLVVVPKDYKTKAIAKGRAINYFVENYVKDDEWYMFLDDDSYPLDDSFLNEIPYYEQRGFVGANGSLVPRRGKCAYTYVLDHFRYLDDVTLFKATQGTLRKPIVGFHGEGLILSGKVLNEIGYNFKSLTEDFRFAMELVKKGHKTWHSNTKISFLSPNSVKDLVRQRARWFKGIIMDMRHAHWSFFPLLPFCLGLWLVLFFGSVPFFVFSLLLGMPFFILFPVGLAYWVVGNFLLPKANMKEKIGGWLISPSECLAPLFAIKMKGFHVIDKSR